jgi:hypothetical protein
MWIGVVRIFITTKNVSLDGEKPIADYFHLFDQTAKLYIVSAVLTTFIMFLSRKRKLIHGLFILGSIYWSTYVIIALFDGLDCTYWRQGGVLCSQLGGPTIALALLVDFTNILLGISLFWRGTRPYKFVLGMLIAVFQNLILFFAFMNV